jgi:hypothetical protein
MTNTRPRVRSALLRSVAAGLLMVPLAVPSAAFGGARTKAACAPLDPDGPCGMDLTDAWATYTTGDPHVTIAYVEGGINWHNPEAQTLDPNIYVNWHETPIPCPPSPPACDPTFGTSESQYDVNHDGVVNALDWTNDPRVHDSNGNGYVDTEDLIVAFSDGLDQDHDGYVDDISGWDFYDDQNDPATYDSTYSHSDDQMGVLQHECPKCTILPVKAGAEALDRTEDLARAWLFAGDAGASVISSVTADLGDSAFMRDAVTYLEDRGVAMVESSNDFDSTDHQGGMFWPYVLPGNAVIPDGSGTRWTRSDYTSWGTHSVFSIASTDGTTSNATPTTAGVIGLLLSYGRLAAQQGLISSPLTGPDAEQVMIGTSKPVTDPTLPWPGRPGDWNLQYGYGIPDLFTAMQRVQHGHVPPVVHIDSPDWYQPFDPTTSSSLTVTGTIDAPRTSAFTWIAQAGFGQGDPDAANHWMTIGQGSGSGTFSGELGTLDFSRIPPSFWQRAFHLSKTKMLETTEEYAVTLRVVVHDANGLVAKDRRAVNVVHDPSWMTGFPLKLGTSGESQPALADLQGTGRLDIVFGDTNGEVHALDPVTRQELPGWPVHTAAVPVLRHHPGVNPGFEPILAGVAVGDLHHTGALDVVATTISGLTYAWDATGTLLAGWPRKIDTGVTPPPIPRPALDYTRLPVMGAVAAPVLYPLEGGSTLDVIQSGWDGYLHVWRPTGASVAGWPVKVQPPGTPPPGYVLIDDQKLDATPSVAFLDTNLLSGPDLVIRPQYTYTTGSGITFGPFSFAYAYKADGTTVPGWPVEMPGVAEYYGSAQEFVTEGVASASAADVTGLGLGPDDVAVAPIFTPPYLISGAGAIIGTYGGAAARDRILHAFRGGSAKAPADVGIDFTTSGSFGKVQGVMSFGQSETGGLSIIRALLTPNSGAPITNYDVVFPATSGPPKPGYPARRQGIDFLSEPIVADVTGDGVPDYVDGGDSNAMQAYGPAGAMADGFPKWDTGWNVFGPVAGDLDGDGHVELVCVTREGYLFAWRTPGTNAGNDQWWRPAHDEWNTGNYEAVTRPPGAILDARWRAGGRTLSFRAPGSTWYSGSAPDYRVSFDGRRAETVAGTAEPGRIQRIVVPAGTRTIVVQALGPTGLLGTPLRLG